MGQPPKQRQTITKIIKTEITVLQKVDYLMERIHWRSRELGRTFTAISRYHGNDPAYLGSLLKQQQVFIEDFQALTEMLEMDEVNGWTRPFLIKPSTKKGAKVPITLITEITQTEMFEIEDMRRRVRWRSRELGRTVSDIARYYGYNPQTIFGRIRNKTTMTFETFEELTQMFAMEEVNGWHRPFPAVPERYKNLEEVISLH